MAKFLVMDRLCRWLQAGIADGSSVLDKNCSVFVIHRTTMCGTGLAKRFFYSYPILVRRFLRPRQSAECVDAAAPRPC